MVHVRVFSISSAKFSSVSLHAPGNSFSNCSLLFSLVWNATFKFAESFDRSSNFDSMLSGAMSCMSLVMVVLSMISLFSYY